MNIFFICLLLAVNFMTTVVAYHRKCYAEFSVCLITNNDDSSSESRFRLNQRSADDWCKRNSSSLAFITNANVQSAIKAFINDPSAKLNSDVITNGYRYNLSYWEWISWRRSANYPFSEYSDYRYAYLLVSAGRGVTLNASLPTTARNFICSSRNHYFNCPNDHHQFGNRCYKSHNNKEVNWFEARNLCIQEENDLATFEYIDISRNSGSLPDGEYWIGLRSEIWFWSIGQRRVEIKYSNWDRISPFYAVGYYCLCLTANTGKWQDCDCSGIYRYICIQGYTPASSTAPASTTTLLTTDTIVTTETDSSSAPTTPITTSPTQIDGHSTLITIVDDTYKQPDDSRMLLVIGLGIVCLLILIAATAVVVHIRTRRSSHDPGPRCDAPSKTTVTNADAPNTVYAEIMPSARESTRSPSERTPNQIVYAELDLIPKGNKDGKALQELEYANSIQLNSVYANCAHTRV